MSAVFLCEGIRTPIGRFGGTMASVRPDDMLAHVVKHVMSMAKDLNASAIDDAIFGCANQAGEDNRNVGRMAVLLAGLCESVSATTINRLCGSGMDAIGMAARTIKAGEAEVMLAGGVESMSRAPFVMPKAESAFSRANAIYDTTIGWRFVNKLMKQNFGIDSMPETAENVAEDFNISREDQDAFAYESQRRAKAAQERGRFQREIVAVEIPQRKADPIVFENDEHLRLSPVEKLAKLATPFRENGTVTAGNASGVNDGAAAVIIASEEAVKKYNLKPLARIEGMATAGVAPRIMGIGPVPASEKLLARLNLSIKDVDVIELNEAFAAQSLACLRQLGLGDNEEHVNPNGGAIALGHPLGMSGTRIVLTAAHELIERDAKRALCTMCIGVGQGIAMMLHKV